MEDVAAVVTDAGGNTIAHFNSAWAKLCGREGEDCVGKSVARLMNGRETNVALAKRAFDAVRIRGARAAAVDMVSYTKQGVPFRNRLTISPLYAGSKGGRRRLGARA